MVRLRLAWIACALSLALAMPRAVAADSLDPATQLYVDTVAAMQNLPEPPYVTYRLVTLDGGSIHLGMSLFNHEVWYKLPSGNSSGTAWSVVFRTTDSESMVVDRTGQRYLSNRSFFDPTWYGAYRSAQHGILFLAQSVARVAQPTQRAVATPAPTPDVDMEVIAVTKTGSALYNVRDRGAAICPTGDAGRALELTPKGDARTYQLRAAVVDKANGLFCFLRFSDEDLQLGLTDSDEQYYGTIGGYWMRIGGRMTRTFDPPPAITPALTMGGFPVSPTERLRQYEAQQTRTAFVDYRFTEIAFPQSEPDDFFVLPFGQ